MGRTNGSHLIHSAGEPQVGPALIAAESGGASPRSAALPSSSALESGWAGSKRTRRLGRGGSAAINPPAGSHQIRAAQSLSSLRRLWGSWAGLPVPVQRRSTCRGNEWPSPRGSPRPGCLPGRQGASRQMLRRVWEVQRCWRTDGSCQPVVPTCSSPQTIGAEMGVMVGLIQAQPCARKTKFGGRGGGTQQGPGSVGCRGEVCSPPPLGVHGEVSPKQELPHGLPEKAENRPPPSFSVGCGHGRCAVRGGDLLWRWHQALSQLVLPLARQGLGERPVKGSVPGQLDR